MTQTVSDSTRPSYAFARRPKWIVMHVIVLLAVSLFAVAGMWQIKRLGERRESNQTFEEGMRRAPIDLGDDAVTDSTRPQRARATGRYDPQREVLVAGRSFKGTGGSHILTPLVLSNGDAVLVDRGWVPADLNRVPVTKAPPPSGRVEVSGVLLPPEPRRPLSPSDPANQKLQFVKRIDPARLQEQLPYDVMDMYLLLQDQDPAGGELPRYAELPERTEGSHLIYAVQWFLFIPTALAVYGALLRRESRRTDQYPRTSGGGAEPLSRMP